MTTATNETVAALRQLLTTLDQVDADGEHRIILQDYTDPLPPEFAREYHTEGRRSDTRDKFRKLGRERYAAGCPVHRASLGPAQRFTADLGNLVRTTRNMLAAEFPDTDLVYLNVQRAFDGGRLCEHSGSPNNALATPVRFQKHPNGVFEDDMSGWDKIDLGKAAETCKSYYQTCQESLHPNAAGHAVLGQCLSAAVASSAPTIECVRTNSSISINELHPSVSMSVHGGVIPRSGDRATITASYSITATNTAGASIGAVTVDASVAGPNAPDFPTKTETSGVFSYTYECPEPGQLAAAPGISIDAQVEFLGQTHQLRDRFDGGFGLCQSDGPIQLQPMP